VKSAEFVLSLLIAVAVLVTVARRLRVAYPIFLVLGGLAIGFVPGLPRVQVDPELIFLLVLPPIVYIASVFTPLRTLRANLANVASLAIGLVIASALVAAAVTHTLVSGMSWPIALVLGAITSPSDEVAVTQVGPQLAMPRRVLSVIEAESLLNDATGVTLYRVALLAALAGSVTFVFAIGTFFVSSVVGIAVGIVVGWLAVQVRRRINDTPVEITLALLTPYAAFLPAQALNASGVIATVVTGLYVGSRFSQITSADSRLAGRSVWEMVVFLLNGFVFVLTGLEVPYVLGGLAMSDIAKFIGVGVAVTLSLIAVRAIWIFVSAYLRRRRKPESFERNWLGDSVVLTWSGMRGVISLAIVLALPQTLPSGAPFPSRAELLVITLTVIVLTLVGQGLTLPWVVRRAHLGADREVLDEEAAARRRLVDAAVGRIDELYPVWPGHHPLLDEMREKYRHRSEHAKTQRESSSDTANQELIEHREIRRTVADAEREALFRLRTDGAIDDDVLRKLERELDLEEQRGEA
jgi:CPA1 family monovalent cation:H+ antiporter